MALIRRRWQPEGSSFTSVAHSFGPLDLRGRYENIAFVLVIVVVLDGSGVHLKPGAVQRKLGE